MNVARRVVTIAGLVILVNTNGFAASGDLPITTASSEARQLYERALDRSENLEVEAAAGLLEQAIAKDPAFAMAYLLRAQSGGGFSVFRENLDKAVSLADKVSAGEKHWILAAKAQADGDSAASKSHLDALLAAFPSDKRVQSRVGFYYRGVLGDNRTAATYFKKATEIDPSYAPAYNNLGYAQSAIGDYAGAEATFKKYIALLPDRPNPYDSYAELLMKTGRYDESIAQYKLALAKDGTFFGSLIGIGTNLVFKKDHDGARSWYQQQLAKSPDLDARLSAMNNIALSYVHEGKTDQAVKIYEEISALGQSGNLLPRTIGARHAAAFILLDAGRSADAERHVTEAAGLIRGSSLPPPVKERLGISSSLLRARVLGSLGKSEEAGTILTQTAALISKRRNAFEEQELNEARAVLAMQQKRYGEALELLSKADPSDPYVSYQQAVATEHLGRAQEASALYEKVAGWNENSLGYAVVRGRALAKSGS